MSSTHLSHQSLQWTRPLLDELCEEVRQAVERFGEEESDRQRGDLDQAVEACDKVAGSLAVMEFHSGQLIAEAMGHALQALRDGQARDEERAISTLLEATAILPDYLDFLETTQRDAPIVVLPTINDLRAAAGEKLLDEANFFQPEINTSALPAIEQAPELDATGLRRQYQHALRGLLVDHEDVTAIEKLSAITLQIRDQTDLPEHVRCAGWVTTALLEALKEGQIASNPNIVRLFARLDVLLKETVESGTSDALDEKARDLTRGLLFQIVISQAQTPLAQEVHEAFKLADHAPDQMSQAKVFLAGRNRALFAAVTTAAREDLAKIKDALGSQLEQGKDTEMLEQQSTLLESVGESLAMLGLDHLAARVKTQAGKLTEMGTDPDDPTLLMVARELLVVESQLEESFGLSGAGGEEFDVELAGTLLPPSEQRRVIKQLVKEALEDLGHSKHLLDAINRQKADVNAIDDAQKILAGIAGALHMAEFKESATMVEAASRIAADHLSEAPTEADAQALDVLAETLTVTEFYLESLAASKSRGERYLESARTRIEQLGYWPETIQPEEVEPEVESPVEPEVADIEDQIEPSADEVAVPQDIEADEFPETSAETDIRREDRGEEVSVDSGYNLDEPQPVEATDTSSAFDDFDIVEIFMEEFDQELETLVEIVPKWQEDPNDEDLTTTIRRSFHSLKGSGRMAGATEIGEFSWQIENMLNRILERQIQATPEVTALVAEAVSALPSMRARLAQEDTAELDEQACAELAERAALAAEGRLPEGADEAPSAPPPELEGMDPTLIELMVKELSENLEIYIDWLEEADESGRAPSITEPMVRIVHTMKGTMRLAPIGDETETAQILEAYLEELSLCEAPPSNAGLVAMEHAADLFRKRLARLQGEQVADEEFQTEELAEELRDLHNQAHRDRTGEHAPTLRTTPRVDPQPDRDEPAEIESADFEDEPAFTSDTDIETGLIESDSDFFDVDDEEVAVEAEADADIEMAEGDADIELGDEIEEERIDFDSEEQAVSASNEELGPDSGDEVEPGTEELPESEFGRELEPVAEEDVDSEPEDEAEPAEEARDEAGLELEPQVEEPLEEETEPEVEELLEDESEPEVEEALEFEPGQPESADEMELAQEEAEPVADEEALEEDLEVDVEIGFVPDRIEQQDREEVQLPEEVEPEGETIALDYEELNEDLLEAFLEEAGELLEHSDGLLQKWREAPEDKNLVTALQRDLHTVKGSSRMVGLTPIGQVAHVMEELLEGIAAGLKDATGDRIDALEVGCDHLHAMVDAVNKREPMPMRSVDELFADQAEEIEETTELIDLTPQKEQERPAEEAEAAPTRTENLRVPSLLIDDLVNYAGEISIFRSRLEQQITVFRSNVGEVDETVIRLRDQLRKLEIETEAQILARYEREHGPADEAFDPLELDRYSTIQQLSRGLAESVNDLTSLTGILDDATRQSETLLMQQSRVNTELQEGLMQARMVSFNTLLPRFRRVVRNAAREVSKKAQLRVSLSGESEMDRNVLDRITAPLEHLLRNAISHGIEMPERRAELGKPETGTISIEVSREATELVMRIRDDGAGLDLQAIRQRAIERDLLKPDEEVTDQALTQIIFVPGFTTADQLSELAGRGIGMDVVANEVRQIGGNVTARSEAGKGAQFTIRIPLSLTVMQAIMVRASDRQFAIPLQSVRGVTRILADDWLREIEKPDSVQEYAGEEYPLLELEPQLDFKPEEITGGTLSLLMIEAGEQRAALRVTELLGHREIVIKPVGPQISSIPGILGGTITGDGQVVPILDMGPLVQRAFEQGLVPGEHGDMSTRETQEVKRTPLVMVVDDSITMRRVTSRVLEHRGLEVMTARDGLDAVEAMFDRIPDLILLDIEMPRMDGYELATHVRNDARLKHIPMMMITSRSGEKHRQRAREIGVDDYLAKPYQESELVGHVFDLLKIPAPEG